MGVGGMATFSSLGIVLRDSCILFCFVLELRNASHSLGDLSNTEDWWDWTLSTLLDELYPERTSARAWGAQVRSFPICWTLYGSGEKLQCSVGASPWHQCHGGQRSLSLFTREASRKRQGWSKVCIIQSLIQLSLSFLF